ncbi:hypothetical protein R3P38DRAFT_3516185 [Favolaschia claudopus]|uniref:Uncharacterized protein n=1 Tax=Favolaschia claudopus TaxID=2862362 RepID=A0AAW0BR51_9AGAR
MSPYSFVLRLDSPPTGFRLEYKNQEFRYPYHERAPCEAYFTFGYSACDLLLSAARRHALICGTSQVAPMTLAMSTPLGAIIGINKDEEGNKRTVQDFGAAPFNILAHRSHVRVVVSAPASPTASSMSDGQLAATTSEPVEEPEDLVSAFEGIDDSDQDDSPPITASSAQPDPQ